MTVMRVRVTSPLALWWYFQQYTILGLKEQGRGTFAEL